MLMDLKWPSLQAHRKYLRLIPLFNSQSPTTLLFTLATIHSGPVFTVTRQTILHKIQSPFKILPLSILKNDTY